MSSGPFSSVSTEAELPSYSRASSAAPSFRSSLAASQAGDNIQEVPQVYNYAEKKPKKLSKLNPLDPIGEKFEPVHPAVLDIGYIEPDPEPRVVSGNIFSRRSPCCLAAIIVILLLVVVAIVLGNVLPHTLKDHHVVAPANATIVLTVTSVVHATTTSSSPTQSPTPSKRPDQNLGGFDAVIASDGTTYMFYTDQKGSLQLIYTKHATYTTDATYKTNWYAANPPVIATNVRPGSPVSASIDANLMYVFYIDTNNTIKGIYGSPTAGYGTWYVHPVGSLQLHTSDTMFIRACVNADATKYKYETTPSLYLYYSDQHGVIQKYGFSGYPTSDMQHMTDLPSFGAVRKVECQFAQGIETLWTVNELAQVGSWYRWNGNNWQWTQGYNITDPSFSAGSILSISESSTNRSHIFFQNADQLIRQYDFSGFGLNQTLTGINYISGVTPGTRLATWANSGYAGKYLNVFYQRGNTSNVYYSEFLYGFAYSGKATVYSPADALMPLIQTYGKNVKHPKTSNVGHPVKVGFEAIGAILLSCLLAFYCSS